MTDTEALVFVVDDDARQPWRSASPTRTCST